VGETKVVLRVGAAFPDWDDVINGDALRMRMRREWIREVLFAELALPSIALPQQLAHPR
jgi:hypothetical protein